MTAYFAKPIVFLDFVYVLRVMLERWGGHVAEAVLEPNQAILNRYFKGPHGFISA